jgi:hypothetical protein
MRSKQSNSNQWLSLKRNILRVHGIVKQNEVGLEIERTDFSESFQRSKLCSGEHFQEKK